MKKIHTSKFIFSKQAKRLPEIIPLDEEFAYTLGLWKADRCSTAKGIVGVRSKDNVLLETFRNFIRRIKLEIKERTVKGYGKTKEVYCCSMPLRRIFEFITENRLKLLKQQKNLILAYLAGIVDGDGSSGDLSHLVIFYNLNERKDAKKDAKLINLLGFKTALKIKKNHIRLYILQPLNLIKKLRPFILLKRKLVPCSLARPTNLAQMRSG
jgi:intein/homing endonuclease